MAKEIHAGRAGSTGGIYMDATAIPIETIQKQIPHVYKTCLHRGIDITKTPLEVAPGSHTWLGGLDVDTYGQSSIPGLFAAGETAGGIHGGNRIGGSALAASLAFGRRAGRKAAELIGSEPVSIPALGDNVIPEEEREWLSSLLERADGPYQGDVRMHCRMLAHDKLGPIRDENTLREALTEYERIENEDLQTMRLSEEARDTGKGRGEEIESALSIRNLALLGRILATAALEREESRGAHYRLDYPDTNDADWRKVTRLHRTDGGGIEFSTDPVKNDAAAAE